MIKYNENTINDWNIGSDNIAKVYYNGDMCYQKVTNGSTPPPPPPAPHTEVEYIQTSSGSSRGGIQLLNTPKEGMYIELDMELSGSSSNSDFEIIGQKDNQETVSYQMGFMQYNSWTRGFYDYGGGRIGIYTCPSFNTRRLWKIGRISGNTSVVGFSCDGTVQKKNASTIRFDANRPYLMGNVGYNGSSTPIIGGNIRWLKIYSVKIYEDYGETLVADYMPVVKKDTNEAVLYDKISGNYATSVGTVIAGDPI